VRWRPDAIVLARNGATPRSTTHRGRGACNNRSLRRLPRLPLQMLVYDEGNGIGHKRAHPARMGSTRPPRPPLCRDRPALLHADGSDMADVFDTTMAAAAWVRRQRFPRLHLPWMRMGGPGGARPGDRVPAGRRDRRGSWTTTSCSDRHRLLTTPANCCPRRRARPLRGSRARGLGRARELAVPPAGPARPGDGAPFSRRGCTDKVQRPCRRPRDGAAARQRAFRRPADRVRRAMTMPRPSKRNATTMTGGGPGMLVFGGGRGAQGRRVGRKNRRSDSQQWGSSAGQEKCTRARNARNSTQQLGLQSTPPTFGGGTGCSHTVLDETVHRDSPSARLAGLLRSRDPVPRIPAHPTRSGEAGHAVVFSQGRTANPMVSRIAGLLAGFGGISTNDNSVAALRDIPGLICLTGQAGRPPRTCAALPCRRRWRTPRVRLLRRSRYTMPRDLLGPGDGGGRPARQRSRSAGGGAGRAGTCRPAGHAKREGNDLTECEVMVNGLWLRKAGGEQAGSEGIGARVLDLRWLAPLRPTT